MCKDIDLVCIARDRRVRPRRQSKTHSEYNDCRVGEMSVLEVKNYERRALYSQIYEDASTCSAALQEIRKFCGGGDPYVRFVEQHCRCKYVGSAAQIQGELPGLLLLSSWLSRERYRLLRRVGGACEAL
jgi:hypothetical protein